METFPPSRCLQWDACWNVRDLGSLPTVDGDWTRLGRLVRADDLCRLTADGREALLAYGIETIIDLRGNDQRGETRHPFDTELSGRPRYHRLSLSGGDPAASAPQFADPEVLGHFYAGVYEMRRDYVGRVLTVIGRAPEGGVVFHCRAGKDRTGMVAALLLSLSGVADDDIADDYELSHTYLSQAESCREPEPHIRAGTHLAPRDAMLAALNAVRMRFGSIEDYVLTAGVCQDDVERLRARLRE